jgi:hypothetical protein
MLVNSNEDKLVDLSVIGEIASPTLRQSYRIQPVTGQPIQLPSVGGISYNANLGDPAVGIAADHVEPGVSIRNSHEASNRALNTFACIGNRAKILSGDAKGLKGWVIGKHGGVEHVMIHFDELHTLEQLAIGDRIQIRSRGTGLQLEGFPDLVLMNMDPALLQSLQQTAFGPLVYPVTHIVPAHLLGAGLGEDSCQSGDVDIQLFDEKAVSEFNLETLRFGDFIAMDNCDHRYGRIYREGWVSIGVITHSCSIQAGHGPGVTTIMTAPKNILSAKIQTEANIKSVLPTLL